MIQIENLPLRFQKMSRFNNDGGKWKMILEFKKEKDHKYRHGIESFF